MARKTYPLKVIQKIQECKDACTLVLSPEKEDQNIFNSYRTAQFLSFHLSIQGKKIIRSYSLSSSPLLNEKLTTTVKKVEKGLASSYLVDHLKEGEVIPSSRPQGKFFKPPADLNPRHYIMVAGGSGITPLFSIIKTVLSCDEENEVTLIYCNRKESSIIYKEALQKWEKDHPSKLRVIHVLSKPQTHFEETPFKKKGRLNADLLKKILYPLSNSKNRECYLCGPHELMKISEQVFIEKGVDSSQIHKESFGSAVKKKYTQAPSDALIISTDHIDSTPNEKGTLKVRLEGEDIEIPAEPDNSILDQLISAGHCPPFSCMEGNCMTCMAVLKKGKIYQNEPGILDEENISAKEILTCQAKPLSSIVEVDYD